MRYQNIQIVGTSHIAQQSIKEIEKAFEDMPTAYNLARKNKARIVLIDQPIEITLQKLSKELTFREKARIVWDIVSSPFSKEKVSFDLRKVPEKKLITRLIEE